MIQEAIETTEPNFEARITALEKAFVTEIRETLGEVPGQGFPPIPREASIAITHINTAAAILRDYARRAEAE